MHRFSSTASAMLVLMLGLGIGGANAGQPRNLNVGDALPEAKLLVPETHRYLRYIIKDDQRTALDIWVRELRIESGAGQQHLRIIQRWDGIGAKTYTRTQDSLFELRTFRPLSHTSTVTHDGETKTSAFVFDGKVIKGDSAVANNAQAAFLLNPSEPPYNFETDMELLQALPLAAGYEVSIPFYDPGLAPPARYVFKVAGQTTLPGPDGTPIPCWLVTTDYNKPGRLGKFWIAKRNQVVVRFETALPDGGGTLVKTLLPAESQDATSAPTR